MPYKFLCAAGALTSARRNTPRVEVESVMMTSRVIAFRVSGRAVSLICPEDQHHFGIIQKKMGKKVEILESDDINLQGF